jgi:hypothetical protein
MVRMEAKWPFGNAIKIETQANTFMITINTLWQVKGNILLLLMEKKKLFNKDRNVTFRKESHMLEDLSRVQEPFTVLDENGYRKLTENKGGRSLFLTYRMRFQVITC